MQGPLTIFLYLEYRESLGDGSREEKGEERAISSSRVWLTNQYIYIVCTLGYIDYSLHAFSFHMVCSFQFLNNVYKMPFKLGMLFL